MHLCNAIRYSTILRYCTLVNRIIQFHKILCSHQYILKITPLHHYYKFSQGGFIIFNIFFILLRAVVHSQTG